MFKLFRLSFLLVAALFSNLACSPVETPDPSEAVEANSETNVAKFTITGRVQFVDIPTEGMTACELIVVSHLEPEAQQRLERQRELLEYKLTGTQAEGSRAYGISGVNASGMKEEDFAALQAEFVHLKKSFPERRIESFNMQSQNGRPQKFSSDIEKHKEYKYLFDSITLDNFERALPFIGDKLKSDNKQLLEEAEGSDEATFNQNKLTLDWLNDLVELTNQYIALQRKVLAAKNAYVDAKIAASSDPQAPQDWDGYSAYYRDILIIDVSTNSLGAAMVDTEGQFAVKAASEGELILRVEYAPNSAYFLISDNEKRVRIANLTPVVSGQ